MKNRVKPTKRRPKSAQYREKSSGLREAFKSAEKAGTDPVVLQSFAKAASSSSIKCEGCANGRAFGPSVVCRSLTSPRAGFHHAPEYSCGFGRAGAFVGV